LHVIRLSERRQRFGSRSIGRREASPPEKG
jgi:hypothetical protein